MDTGIKVNPKHHTNTAMHLVDLPSDAVNKIAALLEPKTVLMASQSSNALAKLLKKHLPSIKCTEAAQASALNLFCSADGALFGCDHVLKATRIAGNPQRSIALKNWIKSQRVNIDAGGFFVKKQEGCMNFGEVSNMERVRIKLWDRPLVESRTYYGRYGNNYRITLYLQVVFFPMAYNP